MTRVDMAITTARAHCPDPAGAARGGAIAHQLARARLADARPDAALGELVAVLHPAIALRRAELLDRLQRPAEARSALAPALAVDAEARAQHRLLAVSAAAVAGAHAEAARVVAEAPLTERPRLAHRAVADAQLAQLATLAMASADLAAAAADRLEQAQGPAAARAARERACELEPDVAEHWDALGRARIAAGAIDDALAAWNRAAELAPAQPTFRIAPIRALVIAGEPARARQRAGELAREARAANDVERLVTASAGAAAAGDARAAITLANEARARRPSDGRLAFLVAQRLAEAGELRAAADGYAELLVCGAHGRPWHRHEVAARLKALGDGDVVRGALAAKRSCEIVDAKDLQEYVTGLEKAVP